MKKFKITAARQEAIIELLLSHTKLDEPTLLKMLEFGAVKLRARAKGSFKKIRDNKFIVHKSDLIEAVFDSKILSLAPFNEADCLHETPNYGVWFKPANIMSQGTDSGDQTSLLFAIEKKGRTPFLVHRLDRETQGLMVVAYHSKAAHLLSQLFLNNKIKKIYHALVKVQGFISDQGVIDYDLDEQKALTYYKVIERKDDKALLELQLETGRLHQIRRHLDMIGAPVMGDPKYGKNNKNKNGLCLAAVSIEFLDPWSSQKVSVIHKSYNFYSNS